jgi:peptidoglycan/xylan/chitin deacetylase (PgdA/CDA1 family)
MSKHLYIYNFHRISDVKSPSYPPMPVKVFERVIQYLIKHYLIIPQEALTEKNQFVSKKPLLILSFDDAYYDFFENALPILEKYKISTCLHIITQCAQTGESFWTQKLNKTIEQYYESSKELTIDELNYSKKIKSVEEIEPIAIDVYKKLLFNTSKNKIIESLRNDLEYQVIDTKMMTWKDLRLLPKNQVSFGSHTHSHANLAELNETEAFTELKTSFDLISKELGVAPLSIAYPNGQYNLKTNDISIAVGYKILYTVSNSINKIDDYSTQNLYHRFNLYNTLYWKNWIKLQIYRYK